MTAHDTHHQMLVRVFRSMLDNGDAEVHCLQVAAMALAEAATDPERCGHVCVTSSMQLARCSRNRGHEGDHRIVRRGGKR